MKPTLRRINIFVVLTIWAAVLAACASPEEIAASDRRTCAGYGFAQGTEAFSNCMMEADMNRKRDQAAMQRAQQQRWLAEDQKRETQNVRPTQEHCMSAGNSVTTGASGSSSTSSFSNTVCSGR
jgi:hypothetical protein